MCVVLTKIADAQHENTFNFGAEGYAIIIKQPMLNTQKSQEGHLCNVQVDLFEAAVMNGNPYGY